MALNARVDSMQRALGIFHANITESSAANKANDEMQGYLRRAKVDRHAVMETILLLSRNAMERAQDIANGL